MCSAGLTLSPLQSMGVPPLSTELGHFWISHTSYFLFISAYTLFFFLTVAIYRKLTYVNINNQTGMNSILTHLLRSNTSNNTEWHPALRPMAAVADEGRMCKLDSRKNTMEFKCKTLHLLISISEFIQMVLELDNLTFLSRDNFIDGH